MGEDTLVPGGQPHPHPPPPPPGAGGGSGSAREPVPQQEPGRQPLAPPRAEWQGQPQQAGSLVNPSPSPRGRQGWQGQGAWMQPAGADEEADASLQNVPGTQV